VLPLGRFRIHEICDGTFALDGGAMFGIIPRPLWERHLPADEKNRVRLALRCLLIEDGSRKILIDDGIGTKWDDKQMGIYGIDRSKRSLEGDLARIGVRSDQITDVVLTHLHFDHAGGTTRIGPAGELTLSFPNATYHLQGRNWRWAHHPSEKDAGSYLPENFSVLENSGRLNLIEGDTELLPGFFLGVSEGHTVGLQLPRIETEHGALIYCADLIPTAAHLKPSWVMGYDLYPLTSIEEKKMLLAQALEEDWILCFEHEPRFAACRVRESNGAVIQGEVVKI
jgi:glyoxylase-like metal-dependent hydrolase (beta-lactamase superfamily II)